MILIYQVCYAPLWRQGFDKSVLYRELSNKQNKGDFHIPECRFTLIRNLDFIRQEYPAIKGKKTDKKDSRWIADLYKFALVKSSFIHKRLVLIRNAKIIACPNC